MSEALLAYERRPFSKQKYRLCQSSRMIKWHELALVLAIRLCSLTLQWSFASLEHVTGKLERPLLESLSVFESLQNLPLILFLGRMFLVWFTTNIHQVIHRR